MDNGKQAQNDMSYYMAVLSLSNK